MLDRTRRGGGPADRAGSMDAVPARHAGSLELPVAELLRRARPLPSLEEMVIDDLSDEEAEAFLAALRA